MAVSKQNLRPAPFTPALGRDRLIGPIPLFSWRHYWESGSKSATGFVDLALLLSGPVCIRDLFPGTFGYRLRHAALSGINP